VPVRIAERARPRSDRRRQSGATSYEVEALARHRDPRTTRIYDLTNDKRRKSALDKFDEPKRGAQTRARLKRVTKLRKSPDSLKSRRAKDVGRQGLEPWTLGLKGRRIRPRARTRARRPQKTCPIEADRAGIPRRFLAEVRECQARWTKPINLDVRRRFQTTDPCSRTPLESGGLPPARGAGPSGPRPWERRRSAEPRAARLRAGCRDPRR